jgi:hypothetical protein
LVLQVYKSYPTPPTFKTPESYKFLSTHHNFIPLTFIKLNTPLVNWCGTIAEPPIMGIPGTKKPRRVHEFVDAVTKSLGAQAVQVVDPDKHGSKEQPKGVPKSVKLNFTPLCRSQGSLPENLAKLPTKADPLSIFVGLFGTIPRWNKGSVVNFAAYAGGYPTPEDAIYAAEHLNRAAVYWNNLNIGVTFRWVS